ncbi:hypothetical protein A4X06_0g6177 [Tilletia controversa]|uniref:Uncharacterized protein n=2 Tax=Tilletia TaxID=13289 RepID=A0A8X7MPH1_9BASI|nr:hypothetical protein A4X06_0g6177 [Tilletia controversa]KAE8257031.1 hypothetical protein A4X03_0g4813 [Tilletia caries]
MPPPPSTPTNFSTSKTSKWTTHLSITTDLIIGTGTSINCVHTLEATLYDLENKGHSGIVNLWSRDIPAQGAYIITNASLATHPMRCFVSDPLAIRHIPAEVDGSNPTAPSSLTEGVPFVSGTGVLTEVDPTRKKAFLIGHVYLNKVHGWTTFKIFLTFEDHVRFNPWLMPAANSLCNIEGVVSGKAEDGTMEIYLRRISALGQAPSDLLQSLGMGQQAQTSHRASRLKELREAGSKRHIPVIDKDESLMAEAGVTSEPPNAPKAVKHGIVTQPPNSPSPAPGTRKRGRAE